MKKAELVEELEILEQRLEDEKCACLALRRQLDEEREQRMRMIAGEARREDRLYGVYCFFFVLMIVFAIGCAYWIGVNSH